MITQENQTGKKPGEDLTKLLKVNLNLLYERIEVRTKVLTSTHA